MSTTECVVAVIILAACAAYALRVILRPALPASRREPPRHIRRTLDFWGLSQDAAGYEKFLRGSATLLLVSCLLAIVASILFRALSR